jgi:WD40 repeat protein
VKVFNRDGVLQRETVRGDVYMNDVNNTKGHIQETTSGKWHKSDKNHFMTSSRDGSIRIWDVNGRLVGVE